MGSFLLSGSLRWCVLKARSPTTINDYLLQFSALSKTVGRNYMQTNLFFSRKVWFRFKATYRRTHFIQTIHWWYQIWSADQKRVTVCILFDFSKAFDRVNHDILIKKLKGMRFFHSVSWVASYLTGRTQVVRDRWNPVVRVLQSLQSLCSWACTLQFVSVWFREHPQLLQI